MNIPKRGDYQFYAQTNYQYRIRALERKVKRLESGEALRKAKNSADVWRRRYDRAIAGTKRALRIRDKECDRKVRIWQEAAEDTYAEYEKVRKRNTELEEDLATANQRISELERELEDSRAHCRTVEHQLAMNSQNSSVPSSQDRPQSAPAQKSRGHKNNSRTKSDRKPGAQPGHAHHPRRKLEPTEPPVYLTDRPAGAEGKDWYMTEDYSNKLLVGLRVEVPVTLYRAMTWRNLKTGATKTSPFPYGMQDEITYGPELKTFVLFCTQYLNVPVRKVQEFLYESTGGALNVSIGWIAELPKEFAAKSKDEMAAIFSRLLHADVVGVDTTVTKNNGKQEAITVACSKDGGWYVHSVHKGREAAEKLPCGPGSDFAGVIVSDRESTFLNHQQCLAHHIRELRGISEMEPNLTWAPDMLKLMQAMIHTSHECGGEGLSAEQIQEYERRYDEILERGLQEYVKNPPTKHYLKGYGVRKQLAEDKEMVLLFLRNPAVPPTNNDSERCLRGHKRHLHQKTTFRSGQYLDYHCAFLSLATTARKRGSRLYPCLDRIFKKSGCEDCRIPDS